MHKFPKKNSFKKGLNSPQKIASQTQTDAALSNELKDERLKTNFNHANSPLDKGLTNLRQFKNKDNKYPKHQKSAFIKPKNNYEKAQRDFAHLKTKNFDDAPNYPPNHAKNFDDTQNYPPNHLSKKLLNQKFNDQKNYQTTGKTSIKNSQQFDNHNERDFSSNFNGDFAPHPNELARAEKKGDFASSPNELVGEGNFVSSPNELAREGDFASGPNELVGEGNFASGPNELVGEGDFAPNPNELAGEGDFASGPNELAGEDDFEQEKASLQDAKQLKDYYNFAWPKDFPDELKISQNSPQFLALAQNAAKHNLTNEGFNEIYLAPMYQAYKKAGAQKKEQLLALGPKAEDRLNNILNWANNNLDESMVKCLKDNTKTAKMVELLESLIAKTSEFSLPFVDARSNEKLDQALLDKRVADKRFKTSEHFRKETFEMFAKLYPD